MLRTIVRAALIAGWAGIAAGRPAPRPDAADAGLLELRPGQRAAVVGVFERMAAEARRLGVRILDEERGLEAVFRTGAVTAADLEARSARIGTLRGELRLVHLRAHLELRPLLDAWQVARYYRLRGRLRGHTGGDAHH